ncbi:MAG: LamG-like jellyroll fold domain-containing protein [Thermoplasmatota archaeon]
MLVISHTSISTSHAVSELVGGLLLVVIAILAFSAIYTFVFPLPGADVQQNSKLIGYVRMDGMIQIEHIGGESINAYRIDVKDTNGTLLDSLLSNDTWCIGGIKQPTSTKLCSADDKLHIVVYATNKDEGMELIFDGILQGTVPTNLESNMTDQPYLISSLMTNSTDEDIICFNKTQNGETVNASFAASSYIFNWCVNSEPFASLLFPFDTNTVTTVKDYSGNNFNGTIFGASWSSQGVSSGCIDFNGQEYITIPYCFDNSLLHDVTIELWVKTMNSSATLVSFNRSDYGEITISNGHVKWTTTADGNTIDIIGSTNISDDQWHHVAVTYSEDVGVAAIFIDGIIEKAQSVHNIGDCLGSGSQISGFIGKGFGVQSSEFISVFTDNFESNKGWTVQNSPYLSDGEWERGTPVDDERGDPPTDYDGSGKCYVTENEREKDIDGGLTWLISPSFDFSSYTKVNFSCAVWYTNDYGSAPDSDRFYINVSNNNGSTWTMARMIGPTTPEPHQWKRYSFNIEEYIQLTDNVKIRFEASDLGSGSVVEAGVDAINITGLPIGGEKNLTGMIDEIRIYERLLSEEQIYQSYVCAKDGKSDVSVIVSEETTIGDIWYCIVTPNDQTLDASSESSNLLEIDLYGGE